MAQLRSKTFEISRNNNNEKAIAAFFQSIGSDQVINISTVQIASDVGRMIITYEDAVPPSVERTIPSDGQVDVVPDSSILVYFNENVTVDSSGVTVKRNSVDVTGFSVSVSDNVMSITNAVDSSTSSYTVVIAASAVTDSADNNMDAQYSFQFSTSSSLVDGTVTHAGVTFTPQSSNPGGARTLWMDDGTNYSPTDSLVAPMPVVFEDNVKVLGKTTTNCLSVTSCIDVGKQTFALGAAGTDTVSDTGGKYVIVTTSGAGAILSLPASPTTGRELVVKNHPDSTDAFDLDPGAKEIDGSTTDRSLAVEASLSLYYDGTEWYII